MGRPGVEAHPRALLRAVLDGKRRRICPHSWPTPVWAQLMIEQITFDTAGMTPRLLYNEKPWLAQPALYTQAYSIVLTAKKTVKEWQDAAKSKEKK